MNFWVTFQRLTSTIFKQVGNVQAEMLRFRKEGKHDSTLFVLLLVFNHRCWGFRFLPTGAVGEVRPCKQDHAAWLNKLEKMEAIKPATRMDCSMISGRKEGVQQEGSRTTGLREHLLSGLFHISKLTSSSAGRISAGRR